GIGERAEGPHYVVDAAARRKACSACGRGPEHDRGEGLRRRAGVVRRLPIEAVEIFLEHQLASVRDEDRVDELRTTDGRIGRGNVADDLLEGFFAHSDRGRARGAPAVSKLRRLAIDVGRTAGRPGEEGRYIRASATGQLERWPDVRPFDANPVQPKQSCRVGDRAVARFD